MPGAIQNLEILSAGTHNASTGKITITESDLDEIVGSFTALQGSNIVKPHLKLGHTETQKWFGQTKGVPTLGWVDKVWRNGKKLLANISDVPNALLDMIRAGRYHNVSAEIYHDAAIEKDGKKFSWVLSAIALLGCEMPAAKDLAGIAAALFTDHKDGVENATPVIFSEERTALFTQEQVDALVAAAVHKATEELTGKHTKALEDKTAELTVMTARATTAEGNLRKLQDDQSKADAVRIVDQAIKDGKILPKQKDFALAFMGMSGVIKFGADNKELSPAQLFEEFLKSAGKQVELGESGQGRQRQSANFASAAEEVDHLTKLAVSEDKSGKLTYVDAMKKVLDGNEDLKQRYSAGE